MDTQFAHRKAVGLFGTVLILALGAGPGFGQTLGPDDTPQLLKAPETPAEYWDAVRFSLNVGRPDQALNFLTGLLASDPPAELLIKIREEDGPRFFTKMQFHKDLAAPAAELIRRADAAARARATDAERIRKFIGYMVRSSQHRAYGIKQLRLAGADAIPHLLFALNDPRYAEFRGTLVATMQRLGSATLPALEASLQSDEPSILADVITVLGAVGNAETAQRLAYHAAAGPDGTRALAQQAIERITRAPYRDAPAPLRSLQALARKYYDSKIAMNVNAQSGMTRLWVIGDEGLESQPVSRTYAEQYHGIHLCQQALRLSPDSTGIQTLMLSIALEKAAEQAGVDQPIPEGPGTASALGLSAGPSMLTALVKKGLAEQRSLLTLTALRLLKAAPNPNAAKEGSAITEALSSPNPRIQFAAVEAILASQPPAGFSASGQVIDILAMALGGSGQARALVIDSNPLRGSSLAAMFTAVGYRGESYSNAKTGMSQVQSSLDYEWICLDPNISEPSVSFAVAALRANPRTSAIPILIPGDDRFESALRGFSNRYERVHFVKRPLGGESLQLQLKPLIANQAQQPLSPAERADYAHRAAGWFVIIAEQMRDISLEPARQALEHALLKPELAEPIAAACAHLPSETSQRALAELAVNDGAAVPLRTVAAHQLGSSLNRFGNKLTGQQLEKLWAALDQVDDPGFHQALAAALGRTSPSRGRIGNRLEQFNVAPFAPAAPAAAGG